MRNRATSWAAEVRFSAGAKNFSFLHSVQNGFGDPTSLLSDGYRGLSCQFVKLTTLIFI
jgi:hypothetical protein